jgi:hypothetical protein
MFTSFFQFLKSIRTEFNVLFLGVPIVITMLLNPGRNGSNVYNFSTWELILFGLCGVLVVVYSFACLFPSKYFRFAYRDGGPELPSHPKTLFTILLLLFLFGPYTFYCIYAVLTQRQ